jgi:hypothetical protein
VRGKGRCEFHDRLRERGRRLVVVGIVGLIGLGLELDVLTRDRSSRRLLAPRIRRD